MTGSASGGEQARRLKPILLDRPGEFRSWGGGRVLGAADARIGSNRPIAAGRGISVFGGRLHPYRYRM